MAPPGALAKSLIPYQHNVEAGLLIGSNCSRAIIPREIITGQKNEPYAQKTELGWGIVGNVSKSKQVPEETVHNTHRVFLSCSDDSDPSHPKTCHFSVKTTEKEIISPIDSGETGDGI